MTEVWLLRHARPLLPTGMCYGAMDIGADPAETRAAAHDFWQAWDAARLATPAHVLCSPRLRCKQLASALHQCRPEVEVRIEPDLAEMDFGDWEGVPWRDIPKAAIDAWTAEFATHAFGGQMCVQDLVNRVGRLWNSQVMTAASPPGERSVQIWVTHAGVIKAALWWLRSGGAMPLRADQWPKDSCEFGQWRRICQPPDAD